MTVRLPKKMLNYNPEGRRNIGRPHSRYGDDFWEEDDDDDDELMQQTVEIEAVS